MLSSSFTSEGPQEDEEIKCPKCFYFFSSSTKPYILPCNHNICLNCINSLIEEKNPKCPICSSEFNAKEKNSFEVNFTFLNIIIKILETKIIFCTKCNKIFYWKGHSKICEQKYFQNCENILDEIKINCEESAKMLKLIKENGDIINKYKLDVCSVTRNIIKEIHKEYITNIRSSIKNELFNTKISLDFKKAKYDMINFIKIFISYPEQFDVNEINKILEANQGFNTNRISSNILCYSYSDIKNKPKALISKKNALSPPSKNNLNFSGKNFKTINNNINNSLSNIDLRKKMNNKINKFLNNRNSIKNGIGIREIISEEKEPEEEYSSNVNDISNLGDEGINETGRIKIKKYHDNNISKFKKKYNNEEIINNNKENISTIQKEKNNNNKQFIALSQQTQQKKKSLFDIKSLLNDDFNDEDENTKNKIIIGLKDIKVISLKQSMNNLSNNKLNVKLIKSKMKFPNKLNLGNISSLRNKNSKLNMNENKKDNNNKNETELKVIKLETPSLNVLRSTDFTKRDYHYNPNHNTNNKIITKNKNKNNNNVIINMSFASTTSGFNNVINNTNKSLYVNNSTKKENLSSRNNSKTLNSFYTPQKSSNTFINPKMLKNFNKTKDLINKIKEYSELISYLSNTINNSVDKNICLLNDIIMNNYELLLSEISFKSFKSQKNYCFHFFPNTYKILLYDPFNNKFTTKNFYSILHNKNNIIINPFTDSNSIIFDDNDLIFISGGETSYDIFIIISLSKNKIIYNKIMPTKKAYHRSILIKNNLYIIGGQDQNKKVSQECNIFNTEENRWHFFPNLKKGRKNPSLCLYNETILYVFNGEDDTDVLDTIEYIDINNLNNKKGWNIIKPIDYGFVWHGMKNSLVINIDKDKILICGGENKENVLFKDCFLFMPSNNNVFKGMDLKVPSAFVSDGCFYKDIIFGIDYKNKTKDNSEILHMLNIKNNYWNYAYINNFK